MDQQLVDEILQIISQPRIYNDNRDQVLGKFNKIQAFWGTGKAYYAGDAAALELTESLPTQRFKAIGYAQRKTEVPGRTDSGHNFAILLKTAINDSGVPQLEQNLRCLFGGANCNVKIESYKTLPDNKCILTVSVLDVQTNNRYPTVDVIDHLSLPQQYQHLNQALADNSIQLLLFQDVNEDELEGTIDPVPNGVDSKEWELAKEENPDPERYVTVLMTIWHHYSDRRSRKSRRNIVTKPRKRLSHSKVNSSSSSGSSSSSIILTIAVICFAILIGVLATQLSSDTTKSETRLNIRLEDIDMINTRYPKLLTHRDVRIIKTRLAVIRQEVSILMLLGRVKDPHCEIDVTFCIAQTIANVTQVEPAYIDASDLTLDSSRIDNTLDSSLGKTRYSVVIDSLEQLPGHYVMNLFKFIDRFTPESRRGLILFVVYTDVDEAKDSSKHQATALAEGILIGKWAQHIPKDTLDSVISRITGSVVDISRKKV